MSTHYELGEKALLNWEKESSLQLDEIKKYSYGGLVKFESVINLSYEIKDFLNTAEEWEEGDLIFDFTTQAKKMLEDLNCCNNK